MGDACACRAWMERELDRLKVRYASLEAAITQRPQDLETRTRRLERAAIGEQMREIAVTLAAPACTASTEGAGFPTATMEKLVSGTPAEAAWRSGYRGALAGGYPGQNPWPWRNALYAWWQAGYETGRTVRCRYETLCCIRCRNTGLEGGAPCPRCVTG